MNKAQKQKFISEFGKNVEEAGSLVVANYKGLNVADMQVLRKRFKDNNAKIKVAKNRLVKKAIEKQKNHVLKDKLVGQLIYAFAEDPIIAPKITFEYQKENEKFKIVAGVIGDKILDEKEIKKIAVLPSKDQIRAKIIAAINAPATKLAQLMKAPTAKVANALLQYSKK